MGLAVGVEKLAGAGLLAGGARKADADTWTPKRPLRRGRRRRRPHRHRDHARRVRADRHGVRPQVRRRRASSCSPRSREKNHAHSTLNPLAALPEAVHARRDHERRDDRLPEHPADVLGQLRRRRGRGRRQRRQAEDALARAAAARGQGRRRRCSPPTRGEEACQVLPERQHAHPQRGQAGLRAGRRRPRRPRPRRAARLLRHRRARALRQPHAVRGGRRRRLLPSPARRGATARRR